jgi:large repetitive protein
VSLMERTGKHVKAVIGLGVVAVSLFGVIAPAAAATTPRITLTTSTPSVGIGGTAKLKATVKPVSPVTLQPTGTVTFKEGATVAGTVPLTLLNTVMTAKLDVTGLPVGNHTFTATYSGDANFTVNTSLPVTIVVGKAPTTTTATSSTPNPTPGQDAKVKAVVKQTSGTVAPTGSVTFSEGATNYGTVPLALVGTAETAKATISGLTLGSHTITATYSGSTTFNASSSTVTITVAKANTTCTLTATPGTTNPDRITMAVSVKPVLPATGVPTGVVTFIVDNLTGSPVPVTLGTTGRAQFAQVLTPGPHSVKVTYPGDTKFNSSTATLNFTV